MKWVRELGEFIGEEPFRGLIDITGTLLLQSCMRTFLVELRSKIIKALLLFE